MSGAFYTEQSANGAIDGLIALGYPSDEIDVIMSDETRSRYTPRTAPGQAQGANAPHDEPGGEVLGATVGALVGGVAGAALGPVAALVSGGGGALVGGFLGRIMGEGMPEPQAQRIRQEVAAGAIVVGIEAHEDDVAEVRLILGGDEPAG